MKKKRVFSMDEQGSSSVLLVIIMVTLLSLGVLSVVSAYSNYKIASKNANWNAVYYEKDGYYQTKIYELEKITSDYGLMFDVYMESGDLLKESTELIPNELHQMIQANYKSNVMELGELAAIDGLKNGFIAHMTAGQLGIKSEFADVLRASPEELEAYFRYPIKDAAESSDERNLSVVVSIYGPEIKVLEYREIPAKFTYTEMQFTDVKE